MESPLEKEEMEVKDKILTKMKELLSSKDSTDGRQSLR